MTEMQYRIGTVTFRHEDRPTWASRSSQVLEALAGWGREGWSISRLNASACLRVRGDGFCLLLERPLAKLVPADRMHGDRVRQFSAA